MWCFYWVFKSYGERTAALNNMCTSPNLKVRLSMAANQYLAAVRLLTICFGSEDKCYGLCLSDASVLLAVRDNWAIKRWLQSLGRTELRTLAQANRLGKGVVPSVGHQMAVMTDLAQKLPVLHVTMFFLEQWNVVLWGEWMGSWGLWICGNWGSAPADHAKAEPSEG